MEEDVPVHAGDSTKEPLTPKRRPASVPTKAKVHGFSKRNKAIGIVLSIALLLASGWFSYGYFAYAGIDTARYQAVYLDNDNVYFGKVQFLMGGNILLKDVFRIQAAADTAKTTDQNAQAAADIRLIKPGNELHAPDDTMLINKDKVLFIENLKTDGKVTEAIVNYQKEKDKK